MVGVDTMEDPCKDKVTLPEFGDTVAKFQNWGDVKECRKIIGINRWRSSKEESVTDLLATLSSLTSADEVGKSTSAMLLRRRRKMLAASKNSASAPDLTKQKPSNLVGSASFSFGPGYQRPRHLKGKMKIPVLEPRDIEYVAGDRDAPGPGQHDIRHYVGKDVGESGGGATGGWMAGPHDTFLRVFKDFDYEATPEFFDRLAVLLPDMPRLSIVEHVKWYINYQQHRMKLEHKMSKFREEQLLADEAATSQTLSKELLAELENGEKQRKGELRSMKQQVADYHAQAERERERWGLKEQSPPLEEFRPMQHNAKDGVPVEDNHRGHPEFKKAPAYTWSASNEIRDVRDNRFSDISHVRSSSHFDVPGPAHYVGFHAKDPIMRRSPSWTMQPNLAYFDFGLPRPDMDAARRQSEMERRLKQAGARKGEITASLIWSTSDALELRVVPPGGQAGTSELSWATPTLAGGRHDTKKSRGRHISPDGQHDHLENISWPQYHLGQPAPPKGVYRVYVVAREKRGAADTPWLCRIMIGRIARWFGGVIRDAGEVQDIYAFNYEGPVDSSTKIQKELQATRLKKPSARFGNEKARREEANSTEENVFTHKVGTPLAVGPGKYTHSTAFFSQY